MSAAHSFEPKRREPRRWCGSVIPERDMNHRPKFDHEAAVGQLLERVNQGDADARDELLAFLYEDLRRQAHAFMSRQRGEHTLQSTALVHEAYLRLMTPGRKPWAGRTHFLAVAATAMRHVLIDHARRRQRRDRAMHVVEEKVSLDCVVNSFEHRVDLLALDEALHELAVFDEPMARAVEMRFFAGLSVTETAKTIGQTRRTFERNWQTARAWLARRLR